MCCVPYERGPVGDCAFWGVILCFSLYWVFFLFLVWGGGLVDFHKRSYSSIFIFLFSWEFLGSGGDQEDRGCIGFFGGRGISWFRGHISF